MDNIDDATVQMSAGYIEMAADIVSAYVSNNNVPASELASLLASVHAAVSGLAAGGAPDQAKDGVDKATPAQIKKSITPDALISFEDGKPYKTLKRHLTLRGLSPEAYREKHGLSVDYPMTAASYSAQRSKLALSLGLGQQRRGQARAVAPDETVSEAPAETKKRAARQRKAAAAE